MVTCAWSPFGMMRFFFAHPPLALASLLQVPCSGRDRWALCGSRCKQGSLSAGQGDCWLALPNIWGHWRWGSQDHCAAGHHPVGRQWQCTRNLQARIRGLRERRSHTVADTTDNWGTKFKMLVWCVAQHFDQQMLKPVEVHHYNQYHAFFFPHKGHWPRLACQ